MAEPRPKTATEAQTRLVEAPSMFRPEPALAGFNHHFETVDGVRLHYVAGGKADGEVIVLLAGFPESWFAWRKVMPLLAPAYRLIAPDMPGQGIPIVRRAAMIRRPSRQRSTGSCSSSASGDTVLPPMMSVPGLPIPMPCCSATSFGAWP
jgi:hypothetical protein